MEQGKPVQTIYLIYSPYLHPDFDHSLSSISIIIFDLTFRIWQDWILDRKANNYDKSRIAAYEYPVDDTPSKVTTFMIETGFPNSLEKGIHWIKNPMYAEGNGKYALVGNYGSFLSRHVY